MTSFSTPNPTMHESVTPKVFVTYLFLGIAALTLLLFPPQWLKTVATRLPWSPSFSNSPTPVMNYAKFIDGKPIQNTPLCYSWPNLDASQIAMAQTLLMDNPLAKNLSIGSTDAAIGLAVTIPVDAARRSALNATLTSLGTNPTQEMRLPNGIRAIPVGAATSQENLALLKTELNKVGLAGYNLVSFEKPVLQSVRFQSNSTEFISQINTLAKERKNMSLVVPVDCKNTKQ